MIAIGWMVTASQKREAFEVPDMQPYEKGSNYFVLDKDYVLDGQVVYPAGYYEEVSLVEGSDFRIYIPIAPVTLERLPSEHFTDGTTIEIDGKDYTIHVENNQYSATVKE